MKKIVLFVFFVIFMLGLGVFHSVKVQAQDVCSGSQCDWVYQPYTYQDCQQNPNDLYGPFICQGITEDRWNCHIPNPGGGGCTCCYEGGCYLNCPGPTSTPDPDDGGASCGDASCNGVETCNSCRADNGSNWNVTSSQNIITLVNGNLTIRKDITIAGTGFAAFIVKGDITVV